MAFLKYSGVGVTAMAAAVPHTVINNYEYTQYFPAEQVKEIVDKVGIFERRFVDDKTCSSDLCFAAAEKLLNDNISIVVRLTCLYSYLRHQIIVCLQLQSFCKID